jgi:hypothetical protein
VRVFGWQTRARNESELGRSRSRGALPASPNHLLEGSEQEHSANDPKDGELYVTMLKP